MKNENMQVKDWMTKQIGMHPSYIKRYVLSLLVTDKLQTPFEISFHLQSDTNFFKTCNK